MEIVQAIGIFAIFAVCVVLMMMRKHDSGPSHHGGGHCPGGRNPLHLC